MKSRRRLIRLSSPTTAHAGRLCTWRDSPTMAQGREARARCDLIERSPNSWIITRPLRTLFPLSQLYTSTPQLTPLYNRAVPNATVLTRAGTSRHRAATPATQGLTRCAEQADEYLRTNARRYEARRNSMMHYRNLSSTPG